MASLYQTETSSLHAASPRSGTSACQWAQVAGCDRGWITDKKLCLVPDFSKCGVSYAQQIQDQVRQGGRLGQTFQQLLKLRVQQEQDGTCRSPGGSVSFNGCLKCLACLVLALTLRSDNKEETHTSPGCECNW